MAQTGTRVDPYTNFDFTIQIDGLTVGRFSECSGYGSSIDVITHAEGGAPAEKKLPGPNHYGNIVLRRGMDEERRLYDWHLDALRGDVRRMSGSIIIQNRRGEPQAQFDFVDAWPVRMSGPALNAQGSEVSVEEVELAVEDLRRVR
jgi:phage tail-like protein